MTTHQLSDLSPQSLVTHQPRIILEENNWPLVEPIYQSVKFTADSPATLAKILHGEEEGFFYSRWSNPTVRQLELLLARLQGQEDGLAVSSGISALSSCFLSLLSSGDHVIMFLESYKPTRTLVTKLLAKFGVTSTIMSYADFARDPGIIPGKTKLIVFESPTNPKTFIPDIELITKTARRHGILTILDNTFAGLHHHHAFPVDLYVHSLTKFASGHGDVMGGVILGSKERLQSLRTVVTDLGPTLDPHAAYLILRGLKTYFLRYQAQAKNALVIATKLEGHPRVTHLLYPGLPSHPQHHLFKKQMQDGGAIISFDIKQRAEGEQGAYQFIERLRMVKLAASLGSTETMVAPSELFFTADLTPEQKKISQITAQTVRMSVGIEDAEDIWRDISQALENLP